MILWVSGPRYADFIRFYTGRYTSFSPFIDRLYIHKKIYFSSCFMFLFRPMSHYLTIKTCKVILFPKQFFKRYGLYFLHYISLTEVLSLNHLKRNVSTPHLIWTTIIWGYKISPNLERECSHLL